jgi:hypothetical protein
MSTWGRAPFREELGEDDEGVVMLLDGRVLALSSLAWTLVTALRDTDLAAEDLAAILVERFGVATGEDGEDLSGQLTVGTLLELEQEGVLSRRDRAEGPG